MKASQSSNNKQSPNIKVEKGISVILEKIEGNLNVQQLGAIILLEADFNAIHKIIFINRLLPSVEVASDIPIEVIGERRS